MIIKSLIKALDFEAQKRLLGNLVALAKSNSFKEATGLRVTISVLELVSTRLVMV